MANRIRITLKYPFFPGFRKPGLLRCCQQMRRFGYTGGFTGLAGLLTWGGTTRNEIAFFGLDQITSRHKIM